jgi:hypothetical protein
MAAPLSHSFALLGDKQRKSLASEGAFLDDEIVTMMLK